MTRARLAPLMLAAMASQALLVVLGPTIVPIADDTGASVAAVAQARSVTAAVAIVVAVALTGRVDALGVRRVLRVGAGLAVIACAAVAAAPTLALFLAAHVILGAAFACLLSAAFAGVAAFAPGFRARAIGHVAGANALAWIVVTPPAGLIADHISWRAAEALPAGVAVAALLTARWVAQSQDAARPASARTAFR